jgi:nicotinate-nucleotide adenylyltransferase
MTMRVAVYGGSFDPPHVAHVMAATYVLSVEQFELLLVLPVYAHAFDKRMAPFEDRLRMCRLALGWLPHVEVSDLESTLEAPNLTRRTLEHLRRAQPHYELRLVVGADVLADASKWHAFDEVGELAPLLVLGRIGFNSERAGPPVLPDVSSTEVRALLARRGTPEVDRQLRQLVPRPVLSYIEQRGLYRAP